RDLRPVAEDGHRQGAEKGAARPPAQRVTRRTGDLMQTDSKPTYAASKGKGVQSKTKPRLPLKEIDERNKKRILELNGEFLNLYRVLGHHAHLLSAWIEFAYTLRRDCTTPRTLRELMILRGAQLEGSAYEWHQHRRWARQQGVPPEQIEDLFFWR